MGIWLKIFTAVFVLFALYVVTQKVIPIVQFERHYRKQGLTFSPSFLGTSFFTDIKNFATAAIARPEGMPVYDAAKLSFGETLPPVWCMHMSNVPCVILNAPEYLEDVYVRLN
jgi:hypothetical protein